MISELEQFLTHWLGSASGLGAQSWLQVFTWIAGLIAVLIAGISLRRNSLQSRAALLLNLYKTWEELAGPREEFFKFYYSTRQDVLQRHVGLQVKHQTEHMRDEFQTLLRALRAQRDPKFQEFASYVGYFELLGMYLKNGYVPLRDILQIYKGPILMVDVVWRNYIKEWEKDSDIPSGLLQYAVFLMDMSRIRSERPFYYWTIYRFRRFL